MKTNEREKQSFWGFAVKGLNLSFLGTENMTVGKEFWTFLVSRWQLYSSSVQRASLFIFFIVAFTLCIKIKQILYFINNFNFLNESNLKIKK